MDETVQYIVKEYWKELRKKKNVFSFSGELQPKIREGKVVAEKAFRIYVIEKDKSIQPCSKDFVPNTLVIHKGN